MQAGPISTTGLRTDSSTSRATLPRKAAPNGVWPRVVMHTIESGSPSSASVMAVAANMAGATSVVTGATFTLPAIRSRYSGAGPTGTSHVERTRSTSAPERHRQRLRRNEGALGLGRSVKRNHYCSGHLNPLSSGHRGHPHRGLVPTGPPPH